MNKKFTLWLVVGLVVLGLISAGVYSVVNAQTTTPTPQAGQGMRGGMMGRGNMADKSAAMDMFGRVGGIKDTMLATFAQKLGLTVEDVTARLKAGESFAKIAESKGITTEKLPAFLKEVCTAAIDQAVKDGKLTQEQADAMKTHMQDADGLEMWNRSGLGFGYNSDGFGKMGMMEDRGWMQDETLNAFAQKLGRSVDELSTMWKDARNQVIDQAVKDGKLTQEQADALKTRLENAPMFGGMSPRGDKGGMMPFGGGRRDK